MKTYKIAVIPGDGIGPDVVAEGIKTLDCVASIDGNFRFEYTYFPWGCEYYLQHGEMMPVDGMDQLKAFDAIFLGAVGYPGVPDHISLRGLLLKIRRGFDEYVNVRPVRLLDGAPCPLKNVRREDINMIVIRENSEGEYAGEGGWFNKGGEDEYVHQIGVFTRKGCERIMRYAFELAQRKGWSVTSVSKGNALNYSMVLWDQVFHELSAQYPGVATHEYLVDAAACHFVRDPGRFQVVVTSNLFGDILTDLGAAIAGGMGLAAGANLNSEREFRSMFEPIHGSAADIAGTGKANPMAAIWSASQLLDFFGYESYGAKVIEAIQATLVEGKVLTVELGGCSKTDEVGAAVNAHLKRLLSEK